VKQAYGHPQFQENTRERNVSCYPLASALKHASFSVSLSSILPKPERQGDVFRQEGKYTWRSKKITTQEETELLLYPAQYTMIQKLKKIKSLLAASKLND
jgi:hypothetical protein